MNKEDLKYFKIIANIQSVVGKSDSYYGAIKGGINVIVENTRAQYAMLWYEQDGMLHPYYWLSPVDLTSITLSVSDDMVSSSLGEGRALFLKDFKKEASGEISEKLSELNIKSFATVPFGFDGSDRGVIFFVSSDNEFTDDDVNVFEILTMLTEMTITESGHVFRKWQDRKVIMSCKNITKSFKNGDMVSKVLKGINFDVFEGEFLCLLGESGCGKSTFLNIIGGLEKADGGTFDFMGKEYQDADEDELTEFRRKNIGFIFQSYNLMPNLTAKQNLDLIGELVENPMDSSKALEVVKLSDKSDNYPSQLSGGQQQRVSIARAIVKKPTVIMADEPTAALDYATSIEVLQVLADVVKNGTTLIMVTHNEEITKMADRVVRFRDGRVYEVTVNNTPKSASELVW